MSSASSSSASSPHWVEAYSVTSEKLFLRVAIFFHLESLLWFADIRRLFRTESSEGLHPSTVGVRGVTSKDQLLALQQELSLLSRRRKMQSTASSLILTRQGDKLSIKQRGAGTSHILLDVPSIIFLRRALNNVITVFPTLKVPEEEEATASWSDEEAASSAEEGEADGGGRM